MNQKAIECYMLIGSHEPIIKMLEDEGITTVKMAALALGVSVQNNLIGGLVHGSKSAGLSTCSTTERVLKYFEKKEAENK